MKISNVKKTDDKKVQESYLGTIKKNNLILESIPEDNDILDTNNFDGNNINKKIKETKILEDLKDNVRIDNKINNLNPKI
jgi:hypothetical protein